MFDHFFLQPRNSIHVEMEIVEPIGEEILGKFFWIFSFWHTPISVQRVSAKSVQSKTFRNFHEVGMIGLDCKSHFGQILVVVFDVLQIFFKVSLLSFVLLVIGTLVAFTKFYLLTKHFGSYSALWTFTFIMFSNIINILWKSNDYFYSYCLLFFTIFQI